MNKISSMILDLSKLGYKVSFYHLYGTNFKIELTRESDGYSEVSPVSEDIFDDNSIIDILKVTYDNITNNKDLGRFKWSDSTKTKSLRDELIAYELRLWIDPAPQTIAIAEGLVDSYLSINK